MYFPLQRRTDTHSRTFFRRCPKALQATYFERILSVRERLLTWWSTLPEDIQTPSVSSPLFRPNVHLKLSYHLAQIFTVRPFIFHESSRGPSPDGANKDVSRQSRRAALVSDALEAVFDVMSLLELLHETMGLARASYTEFSSCRAALLLLLAQSLNQRTERVRTAVELGMKFIKLMFTGSNMSNQSEASLTETIELAVRRLHSRNSGSWERMVRMNRSSRSAIFASRNGQRYALALTTWLHTHHPCQTDQCPIMGCPT